MAAKKELRYYDPEQIVDAPEHHALSAAMGVCTWGTWDHEMRPFEDRLRDFVATFPPADPTRHMGLALMRAPDGSFVPASPDAVRERFRAMEGQPGSLLELLARFGLVLKGAPSVQKRPPAVEEIRAVTRRRNQKLRVLHGGVDVEPADMDAAKAEFLDRQEKRRSAGEMREARQRMFQQLSGKPDQDEK